jgi:Dullard-like phosphatase family protein
MKGLIVLDIDHTLISSYILSEGEKSNEDLTTFDFNFELPYKDEKYIVYIKKRPFLDEFLNYISQNFEIAVFTAADREYATQILDNLGILHKLKFFKSRESLSIGFDLFKFLVYLKKLKNIPDIDLKKTVIIDDTRGVANRNRKNLIHVPAFYHHHKGCENDATLLKVMSVLQTLETEEDWTRVRKRL